MSEDFNAHVESYQEQIRRSQSFAGADHGFYLRAKAEWLKQLARAGWATPPAEACSMWDAASA